MKQIGFMKYIIGTTSVVKQIHTASHSINTHSITKYPKEKTVRSPSKLAGYCWNPSAKRGWSARLCSDEKEWKVANASSLAGLQGRISGLNRITVDGVDEGSTTGKVANGIQAAGLHDWIWVGDDDDVRNGKVAMLNFE